MARRMLTCALVRAIYLAGALLGCSYRGGSFAGLGHDFAGNRVTLGCADVAIARHPDGPLGVVIAFDIGNRCDRPVWLDLPQVRAYGRTENADIELAAYDPRGELRRAPLDGRSLANETIEYRARVPAAFADVCVDAARIVDGAGAWECVGSAPPEASP